MLIVLLVLCGGTNTLEVSSQIKDKLSPVSHYIFEFEL